MPVRVEVPGHGVVEFPDGTDEATMTKALQSLQSPEPEEKSVGGFLSNVVSSGSRFVQDTGKGLYDLAKLGARIGRSQSDPVEAAKLGQDFIALVKRSPEIGRAVFESLKDRYGSGQNIANTLYTDPVGVLADVATVAGVGELAAGARLPRIAKAAGMVERATNPASLAGRAAATLADQAGTAIMTAGIRPSAAVAKNFGGSRKAVVQAIKQERVGSAANAERKLTASVKQADDVLAKAEAAGAPAVPSRELAEKAALRVDLGVKGADDALLDRAVQIEQGPQEFSLSRAQQLKREAQDLAYEADRENQAINAIGNRAIARGLRLGIEQRVPEVAPINERSQRLTAAKRAMSEAEDRPHALSHLFTIGEMAGGVMSGHPGVGTAAALINTALHSPQIAAGTGIALDTVGRALANPAAQRVALGSGALERAILQALLERQPASER
jgi:hypothetical protein